MTWGTFWFVRFAAFAFHASVALRPLLAGNGASSGTPALPHPAHIADLIVESLLAAVLAAAWLREILRAPGRERFGRPVLGNVVYFSAEALLAVSRGAKASPQLSVVLVSVSLLLWLAPQERSKPVDQVAESLRKEPVAR